MLSLEEVFHEVSTVSSEKIRPQREREREVELCTKKDDNKHS
jgi:hypothetical protein